MPAHLPQESPPTSTSETWVAGQGVASPTMAGHASAKTSAGGRGYFSDSAAAAASGGGGFPAVTSSYSGPEYDGGVSAESRQ
jgi:hypothetical protein